MRNLASVEIDRPIEDVFRCATEHMAEWSITVVEETILEEKPEGVGTTFRMLTQDHGKEMEFDGVVTRFDPPRVSAVHMTNKILDIATEFSFEDLDGRTRVTQTAVVTGKGFFRVMMFVAGIFMSKASCKASENELIKLKEFCEEQCQAATEPV